MKANGVARLVVGGMCASAVLVAVVYFRKYLNFAYLAENHRQLHALVEKNFALAGCAYVGCMAFVIGLTVPGATFLSFAGGVLFPQPYAAVFAYLGYVIGAIFSFAVVSFVLADVCRRRLQNLSKFKALQAKVQRNALLYLVVARYTFVFPFWFVNSVSAIVGVSFPTFLLATGVSVIPGSIVYTSAGRSLGNLLLAGENSPEASALLWAALQDPNVLSCLGGVSVCVLCALLAGRIANSDKDTENTDETEKEQEVKKQK
ncbi:unnamed protein product [Amoebophrya sp. A25]|nr:unnamed protein product [Amoebophrya sp. A25]|eukprot:GSA25T00015628001.1